MEPAPRTIRSRSPSGPLERPAPIWLIVAAAVCALAAAGIPAAEFGPLSEMMAGHILSMNVLAPLMAVSFAGVLNARAQLLGRGKVLATAGALQIVVLWSVHAPAVMAHLSGAAHLLLQAILFGTALFFWSAVLSQDGRHRWRALLVLLITGKLFCLLGVLLVFAPRLLYAPLLHGHDASGVPPMLADQQFAGLMMIVACPLSYVLAAVLIAAQWLNDISHDEIGPYRTRRSQQ